MTRQPYLVRLALGRSAYNSVNEQDGGNPQGVTDANQADEPSQAYDNRGNPTSATSAAHAEAQIRAKNEVLEAVGVCERRNKENDFDSLYPDKLQFPTDQWTTLKVAEDDIGADIEQYASIILRSIAIWWLENLRHRVQAGLVDVSIPFAAIIRKEWAICTSGDITTLADYLAAGGAAEWLSTTVDVIIQLYFRALGNATIEVAEETDVRDSRTRFILRLCSNMVYPGLQAGLRLAVSPLAVFSCLEQLHLYARPYGLPPLGFFRPRHSHSPFQWAISSGSEGSPIRTRVFMLMTSAISVHLLAQAANQMIADDHYDIFRFNNQSAILGAWDQETTQEETPRIVKPFVRLRDTLLSLLGWSAEDSQKEPNDAQISDTRSKRAMAPTYRRSLLSTVMSISLSMVLNEYFWLVVMLPLDGLRYRSIASAFRQSPMAQPGSAPTLGVMTIGHQQNLGDYASKIGLCIGLQMAVDTVITIGTWGAVRYIGITKFYWGRT